MAYVPNPVDPTQPVGTTIAQTAAAEFRALKSYLLGAVYNFQAWNPTDKHASITLTSGNLIAIKTVNDGITGLVRALFAKSSGKWYWEVKVTTMGGTPPIFGIATISELLTNYPGATAQSYGYGGPTGQSYIGGVAAGFGAPFIQGDTIGFALDLDSAIKTLAIYKNNVLQGTITPVTAAAYYPAIELATLNDSILGNFDSQVLTYTPPVGFNAFYNSSTATSVKVSTRQTVLNGVKDANGLAAFMSAGTGLAVNLLATTEFVATMAAGFTSSGAVDKVAVKSATVNDFWSALAASNNTYVGLDSGGAAFKTLAPVQYNTFYTRAAQALLNYNGAALSTSILDDFGNTFTAVGGARLQTNQFKFGVSALGGQGANNILDGVNDYVTSASFTAVPKENGWSLRGWVYPTVNPGVGTNFGIAALHNAGNFGALLYIGNVAGTVRYTYNLSSTGAASDIAAAVVGTSAPTLNAWSFIELTFDKLAGIYRLYVNGVQEQSTASALQICPVTTFTIGALSGGSAKFTGYLDATEFLPYCNHPAGTAYAVPTAESDMTVDGYASMWFDISAYKMYRPTVKSTVAATDPTFTAVERVIAGEVATGAAAPSAMTSYAYQGKFASALFGIAISTAYTTIHNLGFIPKYHTLDLLPLVPDQGWSPGQTIDASYSDNNGAGTIGIATDNKIGYVTTGVNFYITNRTTGAMALPVYANWRFRLTLDRGW